jgi:hypothetical protein
VNDISGRQRTTPIKRPDPCRNQDFPTAPASSAAFHHNSGYHEVSLELAGAPDDPRNLWVEPGKIPNPKDAVENKLSAPATQIVSVCRDQGVDEMSLTSHV